MAHVHGRRVPKCQAWRRIISETNPPSGRRLAFVLPDLTGGGAERVALTLIDDFAERGFEIDLVLLKKVGVLLPLVPPGVRIVDLEARRLRNAIWPLVRYLRRAKPVAVQASMWPLTVIAVIARALSGVRTRLVLSDHTILSQHYAHLSRLGRFALGQSIHWFYPRADARVAVSEAAAADLAELGKIDRQSIEVIYNPVVFPAKARRRESEQSRKISQILNVGKLKPEKNQGLLLDAFAHFLRHRPAHLTIVGDGPMLATLQARAADLKISRNVTFAGFQLDTSPYYRNADLFVLTSDYEGFGNVLVEAMAHGVPVVSTDCPSGPREILAGGEYGRLVPMNDPSLVARAIAEELTKPHDNRALRQRSESLSLQSCERYAALMGSEMAVARR